MEDDKDNPNILDLNSFMDIDSKPTPSKFAPKLKRGKVKSQSSIQESNQSTSVSDSAADFVEDDDPVAREIDVFYTPFGAEDTDTQLYIMQYPLRPNWNPYGLEERCKKVKLKPDSSEVEIVLSVDVGSPNYDEHSPKLLTLQKQILSSTKENPGAPCVVGTLLRDKLYLNPVHRVFQFRPSITHMSGYAAELQKQETSNKDNGMSNERWVSLDYDPVGSASSHKYLEMMMNPSDHNMEFSVTPLECMNSLCPQTLPIKPEVSIIRFMVSSPVEERIKEWFCKESQVNRFNALMHFDSSMPEDDLLKILERYAYLVQGSWVAKSSLICKGHEAQLRDYILFLFSNNLVLPKSKLRELKAKNDILMRLLEPLAYERLGLKDWKFREERDISFIKGHKNIVDEQKLAWSTRGQQVQEYLFKLGKTVASVRKDFPDVSLAQRNSYSQGKKSSVRKDLPDISLAQRTSYAQEKKPALKKGSVPYMSNEQKESIKNALLQIFHDQKPRSMNIIIQELRDLTIAKSWRLKVNTLASAVDIAVTGTRPSPDFLLVLDEVTIEVHKIYFLRYADKKLDPVRHEFLGVFARKEPGAEVTKEEMIEACKVLKRDISDGDYRTVVKELCCYKNGICRLKDPDNI